MSDGYITTKHLSGEEALTGVARLEAEAEDNEYYEAVRAEVLEELKEKERKESNIKKRKKEKTVANR